MCAGKDGRRRGPGGGARHSKHAMGKATARPMLRMIVVVVGFSQ
jgi:hypothetical protein